MSAVIPNTNLPTDALDQSSDLKGWSGYQGGASAAKIHGGFIQYVVPDNDGYLTILTVGTEAYRSSHQFEDLTKWAAHNVKDGYPHSLSGRFKVRDLISIVSHETYNYIFWREADGQTSMTNYHALRVRPDMAEPPVMTTLDLTSSGDAGYPYYSNAAAFLLPSDLPDQLTEWGGKIGVVIAAQGASDTMADLMSFIFDPAAFEINGTWSSHNYTFGSNVYANLSDEASKYTALSAATQNRGARLNETGTEALPQYALIINLCTGRKTASFIADLLGVLSSHYTSRRYHGTSGRSASKIATTDVEANSNTYATLFETPDGRLLTQFVSNNEHIHYATYEAAMGGEHARWKRLYRTNDEHKISTKNTPCTVFIPLAPTVGPSPVPVIPDSKNEDSTAQVFENCNIQNYIQCVFSSEGGTSQHKVELTTLYWGCIFNIPEYSIHKVRENPKSTLTLVADTFPYPIPDPAVWGPDSPSGMVNWLLCEYEYLTGDSDEISVHYDTRGSFGTKFEQEDEILGIGVKAEGGASAGLGTFGEKSNLQRRATSFSVVTKGFPGNSAKGRTTLPIAPAGTFFGSPPPATVAIDVALLLLRGETETSGNAAFELRPVVDGSSIAISGEYNSFLYTPGNLLSYTETAINANMSALFLGLNESRKKSLSMNGEDYSSYYTDDYVKKIIARFGQPVFGPNGDLPYLEFAFSETGIQRGEFQSTVAFTDGGSQYIDGELYGGLAWSSQEEVSAGFLGLVEVTIDAVSAEGFLMFGAQFSSEMNNATTDTKEWGVGLGEYLNPLAMGEAYTVRMYLLNSNPLWARELDCFGGPSVGGQLDTYNSSPVRILFTVPYISETLRARLALLYPG